MGFFGHIDALLILYGKESLTVKSLICTYAHFQGGACNPPSNRDGMNWTTKSYL